MHIGCINFARTSCGADLMHIFRPGGKGSCAMHIGCINFARTSCGGRRATI
jgi:hypothetical protein